MDSNEARAREFVDAEYERDGFYDAHKHIRNGARLTDTEDRAVRAVVAALSQQPEARGVVDAALDLVRLVDGPGCVRWQDGQGFRLKDTREWVALYVATRMTEARNG